MEVCVSTAPVGNLGKWMGSKDLLQTITNSFILTDNSKIKLRLLYNISNITYKYKLVNYFALGKYMKWKTSTDHILSSIALVKKLVEYTACVFLCTASVN